MKSQSNTFQEAIKKMKSKGIYETFIKDWNNTINAKLREMVKNQLRGKIEQKVFYGLFKRSNSNYRDYWLECWKFYTYPLINEFPSIEEYNKKIKKITK